jgi:cytidine deaminase
MARGSIPWSALFAAAAEARRRAYAPYSGFSVGAAAYLEGSEISSGCNVENSSYSLSVCAERNAIACGIARLGPRKLLALAILTGSDQPAPPCGGCRQVMAEFAGSNLPVRSRNLRGREKRFTLRQLLPDAFSRDYL